MEYLVPIDTDFVIASQNDSESYKLLEVYSIKYKRVVNDYATWNTNTGLSIKTQAPLYFKRLDMNQTTFNMISLAIVNEVSLQL